MISPRAVIGDVHTLFALACGADQRPVGIDRSLLKEVIALASPNVKACLVDSILQATDVGSPKAAAEIAGRRGIGNPLGSQCVEKRFVVSPQFNVF